MKGFVGEVRTKAAHLESIVNATPKKQWRKVEAKGNFVDSFGDFEWSAGLGHEFICTRVRIKSKISSRQENEITNGEASWSPKAICIMFH